MYIYSNGESFKISEKANSLINELNKRFAIKIKADKDENDEMYCCEATTLTLNLYENNKWIYKLIVEDYVKDNKLTYKRCVSMKLKDEYLEKLSGEYIGKTIKEINDEPINEDDLFVEVTPTQEGFKITSTVLSDDEEHDIVTVEYVKDEFMEYLRKIMK